MGGGEGLTGEVRVVNGHVAAPSVVEDLELGLVGLGDVGKVLLVVGVDVLGIGPAGLVAEVVPLGRRQRELGLLDVLGREVLLEVVPLVDVGAADVLDLARADDGLSWLVAGLGCGERRRKKKGQLDRRPCLNAGPGGVFFSLKAAKSGT